jgi:hypothetical protein
VILLVPRPFVQVCILTLAKQYVNHVHLRLCRIYSPTFLNSFHTVTSS